MSIENPFAPHPGELLEEPRDQRYEIVRQFNLPVLTRRLKYPFLDLQVRDALIFESHNGLKNALQSARKFKQSVPKFKVVGRQIQSGPHAGKYALIRTG